MHNLTSVDAAYLDTPPEEMLLDLEAERYRLDPKAMHEEIAEDEDFDAESVIAAMADEDWEPMT